MLRISDTRSGGTAVIGVTGFCAALRGTVFETEDGIRQIQKELAATSPEEIKNVHPWTAPDTSLIGNSKGLADAGFSLPPYHYRCRCTIDVSSEINSFSQLKPISFPL